MIVRFDVTHGDAHLDVGDGMHTLRRPTLAEWCDYQDAHEQVGLELLEAEYAATDAGGVDDARLDSNAAAVNRMILEAHYPGVLELGGMELLLVDRGFTAELLTLWRDRPLSPWISSRSPEAADEDRIVRSRLTGTLGARAILYRALRPMSPAEIDRCELWQLAVLLGRDEPGKGYVPGKRLSDDYDDGGRAVRRGNVETRSWRRKPGAPFLFSPGPN